MSSRRKEQKNIKADPKKQAKLADPLRSFAEKVRDHKEFDSRWAVLQEARVEYFRGKDFAALVRQHPELSGVVAPPDAPLGEPAEEELAEMMLRRKLIVRCDRVVKTVRAGRKKLSKWPARLELHPVQSFTEDDGFYAWTFERRRPVWQTLLSFMVPVITVACCLFPVFPHWAKLTVLYFCLSFLSLIFGVLLLRWLVFGMVWILAGRRVWFFPNILAEEASLGELFRFLPDWGKDEEPPPKLTTRIAVSAFTAVCLWLSVRHAPDENTRAKYRKKVGNIIDEVLMWSPAMLAGNQSFVNETVATSMGPPNVTKVEAPELNETETIQQIFARAAGLAADLIGEEGIDIEDDVLRERGEEQQENDGEKLAEQENLDSGEEAPAEQNERTESQ